VQPGDWLRLRATIDFTTDDGFGGVGSLSMSYANLSAGETTFTPVAMIQDIDIHLFGAPEDLNSLNVYLLRDNTDHNIQIDNISIGPNPNFPELPTADYNNDGQVDAADYTVIIDQGLGQEAYDDWVAAFGTSTGGGAVATPEPATLVLLTIAIAGAALHCRASLIGVVRKK
jgi:hypothetical protein